MRQFAGPPAVAATPTGRDNDAVPGTRRRDRDGDATGPLRALASGTARLPGRIDSLLRVCRFYLLSFVYGAAVYGFVVAYLLALGAMTEPMPAAYPMR